MMLSCSHDNDKKAGQKTVFVVKISQEVKCCKFYSFCLQSAGFYLLRCTKCHGQGERTEQPRVTIQMTDLRIDCTSHRRGFNFEYVIGYLNATLSICCG